MITKGPIALPAGTGLAVDAGPPVLAGHDHRGGKPDPAGPGTGAEGVAVRAGDPRAAPAPAGGRGCHLRINRERGWRAGATAGQPGAPVARADR